MNPAPTAVVTTIREPTPCLHRLAQAVAGAGGRLVVVGDRNGPSRFDLDGAAFLPYERHPELPFSLARLLPDEHYARKNLGYLAAIRAGAACIYETDDDNAPLDTWAPRSERTEARKADGGGWLNVYRLFSDDLIWPRGFPISLVNDPGTFHRDLDPDPVPVVAPIQQGLADGSPDVDAVWRCLFDRRFVFRVEASVHLPPGTWCPLNSQSTWWWPVAYPLLYLPGSCSFRLTDTWRGFIAQRCLWALGLGVVFHSAEVVQHRNPHDLRRDLEDEYPGHLGNERIARILNTMPLEPGAGAVGDNLLRCYERLSASGFFPPNEVQRVRAWLSDLRGMRAAAP